jgi:hypothetical protein
LNQVTAQLGLQGVVVCHRFLLVIDIRRGTGPSQRTELPS